MIPEALLVALVVFQEARSAPVQEQRLVAEVIYNRVAHRCWPNTVRGVVYQKAQFSGIGRAGVPQTPAAAKRLEPEAWKIAVRVATSVQGSKTRSDFTHFVAKNSYPKWRANGKNFKYMKHHVFFKLKSGC